MLLLTLQLLVISHPYVNGAVLITPVSVIASESFPGDDAGHLIDGSGLSSTTLPDVLSAQHAPWSIDNSWRSANDTGPGDLLTFDLGGVFDLSNLLLWNTDRGIGRSVAHDISVAFAGPDGIFGSFQPLPTLAIDGRINNFPVAMSGVAFVQFMIDSYLGYDGEVNWHAGSLGEVRFVSAPTHRLRITSISLSSGGDLQPGGTLDFAAGDVSEWGNTQPDEILCVAETSEPNSLIVWEIEGLTAGRPTQNTGLGTSFAIGIIDLPPQNPFQQRPATPRPAIQFTVIAKLLDVNGIEIDRDQKLVQQSALGSIRQEYLDFPADPVGSLPKVPPPAAFIGLQIITGWAIQAANVVVVQATSTGLNTSVTSIYRSPVHNWNEGGSSSSQHMWGRAVDFDVLDWGRPPGEDAADWQRLARVARSLGYHVVYETNRHGRQIVNHVHIQQLNPATGREY